MAVQSDGGNKMQKHAIAKIPPPAHSWGGEVLTMLGVFDMY